MNNENKQNQIETQKQSKVKKFFKKLGTRNLIVICAVLLIGMAVVVNYILYNDQSTPKDLDVDLDGTDLDDTLRNDPTSKDYFAQTSLSRTQSRDEAIEVLQSVADNQNATPEAVQAALSDIARIAKDIDNESKIETLVKAKGFEECIAVINENKATVIVKADDLLPNQLAQIKKIVYEQAGIVPTNLNIIKK